jgi:hypothetical protein
MRSRGLAPVSAGVCLLLLLLLAAPVLGYAYLGAGGALGGVAVFNLGFAWFFRLRANRAGVCAACGRGVVRRRADSGDSERLGMPGVFVRSSDLLSGRVSPGSLCARCGRLYCGCAYPRAVCVCGSHELRAVAVAYLG